MRGLPRPFPMVPRPSSVAEVAELLNLANATGTQSWPQAAIPELVGGQMLHNNQNRATPLLD